MASLKECQVTHTCYSLDRSGVPSLMGENIKNEKLEVCVFL
jgi:hypothetical protein